MFVFGRLHRPSRRAKVLHRGIPSLSSENCAHHINKIAIQGVLFLGPGIRQTGHPLMEGGQLIQSEQDKLRRSNVMTSFSPDDYCEETMLT